MLEYRAPETRWTIVPIHTEMDIQATRISDLCTQAVPGCIVHVMPLGPDSFEVKVKDEENVLIGAKRPLYTHELAEKTDDELWALLEVLSNQRIKRMR